VPNVGGQVCLIRGQISGDQMPIIGGSGAHYRGSQYQYLPGPAFVAEWGSDADLERHRQQHLATAPPHGPRGEQPAATPALAGGSLKASVRTDIGAPLSLSLEANIQTRGVTVDEEDTWSDGG